MILCALCTSEYDHVIAEHTGVFCYLIHVYCEWQLFLFVLLLIYNLVDFDSKVKIGLVLDKPFLYERFCFYRSSVVQQFVLKNNPAMCVLL